MNALALADSQEQAAARPAVREAVRVTVLRDFEGIRAEWRALNDVAQAGTMFSGPEWLIPWWNHFGQGRELQLLAVREGGQLVGLLPLFAEQARYGGVEVRRLAFLGDGATGCDHLDALALPGREAEVLSAVLAELLNLEWDLLDLDGIRRDSPTVIHLAEAWPAHRVTNHCVRDGKLRFVCPHLPLKGTYEELLEGMGRRENLRRREKWLSRQPGVSIDLAQTPTEAPAAIERFFQLHDARWRRRAAPTAWPTSATSRSTARSPARSPRAENSNCTHFTPRAGRWPASMACSMALLSITTSPATSRSGPASRWAWCSSRARCRTRSRRA